MAIRRDRAQLQGSGDSVTGGKRAMLILATCALIGVAVAIPPAASAAGDFAETETTVTVHPGPLALHGVPAERSFNPPVICTPEGLYASLPAITVVDATGSGHGWHLAMSVPSGGKAWARAPVSAYNGPPELRPRSSGNVQLADRPRTVAYAVRDHGMGTTVLIGLSVHARPGVRVRFVLEPGP
jgi:hypothetical protein